MQSKQNIYISTLKASRAVRDKDELDCLAFCTMGKLIFGCSIMIKTSVRDYKYMFRMGVERFKRILSNCLMRGYITDCGDRYRFNAIKEAKAQNALVSLPNVWDRRDDKRSAVTLNQVKDYIRKVVEYDKLDKKDSIENALRAKANPATLKVYRKAKKLCSRISHNSVLTGKLRGTSMARVANNMNTYKAKARRLMREMVADGWISNRPVTIKTNFKPEQFSRHALTLTKEMGWHGSYFCLGRSIFCKVANIYSVIGDTRLRFLRTI